ncbi:MAG: ArsR/SmtB family transcription factor [Planctomycetota bacterium]|jgi:DNA-binding transcriptional ArsR family regulator
MSDRSRLRAMCLLAEGELCLCEVVQVLGLAPSTISTHMTALLRAGLVEREKRGRWQFYRLPTRSLSATVRGAIRTLQLLGEDPQLEADARKLRQVKRMKPGELTSVY